MVSSFFLLTFALFPLPIGRIIHVLIGQTRQLRFLLFFLVEFLLFPIRIRLALSLQIYIYVVIRNTHLHIGWRRKTNAIYQYIMQSKANVDHHTSTQQTFLDHLVLIIERQEIIVSNEQIRLLDCLYIDKFSYIIEREWHFNDMYHTNMVLFGILLNVNRCRRCFHKFLSNMTLIIIFCLYISLYSSYTTNESTVQKKKIVKKNKKRNEKKKTYRHKQDDDREYLYIFICIYIYQFYLIYVK